MPPHPTIGCCWCQQQPITCQRLPAAIGSNGFPPITHCQRCWQHCQPRNLGAYSRPFLSSHVCEHAVHHVSLDSTPRRSLCARRETPVCVCRRVDHTSAKCLLRCLPSVPRASPRWAWSVRQRRQQLERDWNALKQSNSQSEKAPSRKTPDLDEILPDPFTATDPTVNSLVQHSI